MNIDPKFNVQVELSPQLQQALSLLEGRKKRLSRHPLIRKALNDGARYLMNKGKERLKQGLDPTVQHTGNLMHAFTARVKRNREGALAGFTLAGGKQSGHHKGDTEVKGWHAWLVDRGTEQRTTREGYNRGRSGHGKNSHSSSLGYWTKTRENDGDAALSRVMDGVDVAFSQILGR